MRFDGRSLSRELPRYTLGQRLVVRFSTAVMPALTRIVLSNRLNTALWRALGCRVGRGSVIRTGTQINAPFMVSIGERCSIHGHLKSRGGIRIGDGVELVEEVLVSTQSHRAESPHFESVYEPVSIEDAAWVGPRAMILPGVTLRRGTMVAAGAVVTRDTAPWGVYAGVPSRRIKDRAPLDAESVA